MGETKWWLDLDTEEMQRDKEKKVHKIHREIKKAR